MATRPPVSLKLSRRSRILLIIAAVIVLALLAGVRLLDTYVDWLWFGEVQARSVFTTQVVTRIVLFLAVGLLVGGALAVSLLIAYRTRPVFVPVSGRDDPLSRYRSVIVSRIRLFGIGIPVLTGVISGASASGDWQTIQLFLNGTSFGQKDPEFGIDLGFYAFSLPFVNWLLGWLFVTVVVSFFGALIAHYIFGGIRLAGRGGQLAGPTRAQLAITVGLFVLLKAVEYFFDRYNLLLSDRNMPLFNGATYTDLNAVLPAKLILLCISVICAIAFFAGAFLRNLQLPAISLVLLILSGVLVGVAWPAILDQFSVKPNANEKEATSIQRNMDATRAAYGLTNVKYEQYPGKTETTADAVKADTGTVSNIRLLDPNILSDTFTQRVGRENFYGFPSKLDIDRYTIGGTTQDYIVAAKEMKTDGLTGNQNNWINKHMVYTHGNGFVAAPANTIDRAVKDSNSDGGYPIATTSDTSNPTGAGSVNGQPGIKVDQPRIYYGELTNQSDYAIVGGTPGKAPGEYDTDAQRGYLYQGKGGVSLDNWFNRLMFAAEYREPKILFSDAIGDGSKIMYNREPRDRVAKVAPWLTLDGDPYPAVVNGRIQWIVDGYTTLDNYPYAQQTQLGEATNDSLNGVTKQANNSINYIRNSVKATVDAFDGTVNLYSIDDNEPVLKAWEKVFPGTVKPSSEISPELRSHFRYPEDLFKIQRELLARYHVDSPQEFYAQQAFWSVPQDPTEDGSSTTAGANVANQPGYYVLANAAGEGRPTFQLTSALTGLQRQYLSAWMSISSDPEDYGTIRVLRLPPASGANQVDGPVQVQNRFQSDPRVAQDRTLLNNPNVIPIYGNLITLPVADGFLYVEPVYIRQRNQLSYPQLARVLVSYGAKIGFASTLNEALDQVFGKGTGAAATTPKEGDPGTTTTPPTSSTAAPPPSTGGSNPAMDKAVADIQAALAKLKAAQQSGNFADQGAALAALDAATKEYNSAKPTTPPPSNGPTSQPGG
ncbi:membrane protein [Amycolatopsis sp. A1MSW2902]